MRRVSTLFVLALIALVWAPAPARAGDLLGELQLKAWDVRKEVFFHGVKVERAGCSVRFRYTFFRPADPNPKPIKLRVQLQLDAGPAAVMTAWHESKAVGIQTAQGELDTSAANCWVAKATRLKSASFEVLSAPPPRRTADGREFMGKVVFNRWGSSGDVYYRHIQTWRKACSIHYQFLYKRHTPARRKLRLRLTFDNETLLTPWMRSEKVGWREIVGRVATPNCWAGKTQTLKNAGFESERY